MKAYKSLVAMMWTLGLTLGAAHAATFTVNSTADPGSGGCTAAGTGDGCTLREAMTAANAGSGADTIDATGISGTINLTGALPDITASVTLNGPGAALLTVRRSSGGDYRIFTVNAPAPSGSTTVAFSGLTISDGNPLDGLGGGIYTNFYSTVNVTNCTLSGNFAYDGGAIGEGGGIDSSGSLNVSGCTFSGNMTRQGGGIGAHGGTVTVTNSTFSGNSAGVGGGGIINDLGTMTVTSSTFSGNTCGGQVSGGAGILNRGTLTITNSTLTGNSATGSDSSGGGILNSGTANVNNCTLSGNSVPGIHGSGGGIYGAGTTTLRSSIVALNTAGDGGPDLVDSNGSTIKTGGYNLIGNNQFGGAAFFTAGNPNGNNDIVGTNAAPINPGLDGGGLLDNGGSTKTIALLGGSPALDKGKNFSGAGQDQRGAARPTDLFGIANASGGDGTDIGAFERELPQSGPTFVVTSSSDEDDGACTLISCSLREAINAANGDGVASSITFAGGVRGSIGLDTALPAIVNNGSLTISGPGARLLAIGAVSFQSIDDFTVNSGASAAISGLTIGDAEYGVWNRGTVSVTNCTITSSYRGILNEPGGTVNVTGCTMNNCDHGLSNFGTANAVNCTLSSNFYGIFNNAGTVTATHCTITANGGVGIYNGGPATIKNTICAGNSTNLFNVPVTQQGNNLTSGDPLLGPLAYNGGPTDTHALLTGSPAIDACNSSLTTDQRGSPRPMDQPNVPNAAGGNGSDIGAFEVPVYSITGRVTIPGGGGLANVRITRTGSASVVFSDSNGNFSFSGLLAGAYTLTPSLSGYAFTPATRTATVNSANVTGQNFTAFNWTLSGRVFFGNGNGLANCEVRLNTGRSILTNGAGYYTFAAMIPGSYTITPVLSGYSFDPALRQVSLNNGSIGGQNFTGGYSISGRLSNSTGLGITGHSVYRTGSSVPAISNSAGYYFFYGLVPGSYTVTPDTTTGYGFTPQSRSVTIVGSHISGQNFTGTTGYRVMGRIATSSGTGIANVGVSRGGAASPVMTNSAGYFIFYGVPNGSYTLTPTRAGTSFTPATRSVVVNGADVPGQNFTGQ